MTETVKTTVVDYEQWWHGNNTLSAFAVLQEDGSYMFCCMGFRCMQHNPEPVDVLTCISFPSDLNQGDTLIPWEDLIASANDEAYVDEQARLDTLRRLFRKAGEEIQFTNLPEGLS